MSDPVPTAAELREAKAKGVTVYRLRLERGTTPPAIKAPTMRRSYLPARVVAERHGDTLCGVLFTQARSKKNSPETIYRTKHGVRRKFVIPSNAYRQFAAEVKAVLLPLKVKLGLPLPAIPYSLSVVFFVEDERADVDNLVVGLNDALQGAGVFTNDRIIRGLQVAPPVLDVDNPRIAFTLTPAAP